MGCLDSSLVVLMRLLHVKSLPPVIFLFVPVQDIRPLLSTGVPTTRCCPSPELRPAPVPLLIPIAAAMAAPWKDVFSRVTLCLLFFDPAFSILKTTHTQAIRMSLELQVPEHLVTIRWHQHVSRPPYSFVLCISYEERMFI